MGFARPLKAIFIVALVAVTMTRAEAQSKALTDAVQQYQQLYSQRQYPAALPFAQRALDLAQTDETLSAWDRMEILNDLAELYYLRGSYAKAEELARQVLTLRQKAPPAEYDPHAIAISEEDIAELLDLQGKMAEAAVFHKSAEAFLHNPTLGASATSALGRQDTVVKQSVFDFYDTKYPEDRGYGRYTYVLFPTNGVAGCDRCLRLLSAFIEGTPVGPVNRPIRAQVNVFELPVTAGHRENVLLTFATPTPASSTAPSSSATRSPPTPGPAGSVAARVLTHYNFRAANEQLTKACASYRRATGKFCGTLAQGPYFVTYPRPVSADKSLPAPYLIIDMSNVNPLAFRFFIERVKQQVGIQDLRDESRINNTFTRVVSLVLDASEVVDPTAKAVTLWVKLVK